MTVIESKVKFTKEDVKCIKKLGKLCKIFNFNPWEIIEGTKDVECMKKLWDVCKIFNFTPWEVIEAVENKCGLNNIDFEHEGENNDKIS